MRDGVENGIVFHRRQKVPGTGRTQETTMTTIGRFVPLYDAWSNESGGRAAEEATRLSERKAYERILEQYVPEIERTKRADANGLARIAAMQDAFIQRYGANVLANKDALLRQGPGDDLTLTGEGKAMLADLANLEKERVWVERLRAENERARNSMQGHIDGTKALYESRQNSYDARFERDDEKRADAYERAQAAGKRLEELGARAAEWNAQSVKRAAELAAATDSSKALLASAKLFQSGANGEMRIDTTALANMGTTEAATAELARLIGALAERNGLRQLRDALIGAIKGQNRRIADRAGASA
ncbi:MAG: hypothetical protein ACKO1J_06420 [Tagaea sp.]